MKYCRIHASYVSGPDVLPETLIRVWDESWSGDMFDVLKAEDAIAKHGATVRFLFDYNYENEDWDGESVLSIK